jgi:asparagine synthase (glutamine-hydrolysing)
MKVATAAIDGPRIALSQWIGFAPARRSSAPEELRRHAAAAGGLVVAGPADGCQTGVSTDGQTGVVFSGYLFGRDALARTLQLPGGATDAVIVMAAYARWERELFDRLDGCYLAAVWDAARERLLLGHDALGHHPVFYATSAEGLWFASNVLALARSGRVPPRPNRLSLALNGLLYWPEAGETHFEAIRRIRPGHVLEAADGSIRESRYWEPMPREGEPLLPERQVLEQFEPSLVDAVRRAVEVGAQGVMLSGGLDSVVVAALAAEQRGGRAPLVAVSARTGEALNYEEEMQSRVAETLRMPHAIVTTTEWLAGRDTLALSLALAPELPSPSDVWWVGSYVEFYRWTAARGLSTLLTGAGGDNWLGVADAHAADLLRRGDLRGFHRFYQAQTGTGGRVPASTLRRLLWRGGVRWHLESAAARIAPAAKTAFHRWRWRARLPGWLAPDAALREELLERLLHRRIPALTPDGRAPASYYVHSLRAFGNPYMHHENETAFHMESMCGLRLVSPYHDRRLVTFFNRIPPSVLLHGGRYKGLLRPIAENRLPSLGLGAQRKEYQAGVQKRKRLDLLRSVEQLWPHYDFETLADFGVLDPVAARRGLAGAPRDTETLSRMVGLMMAERWARANATR